MFFIKDTYATIWHVEDAGNYVKCRITTSEKNAEGNYEYSNWFANFIGKAKETALELEQKDKIKILKGKVTNKAFGEQGNKKSYLNVAVFEFEKLDAFTNDNNNLDVPPSEQEAGDDDLPF